MNDTNGYARRYHWLGNATEEFPALSPSLASGGEASADSTPARSFVCEPHAGVASPPADGKDLLNMVAAEAEQSRQRSVELAGMDPDKLLREIAAGPSLFMPAHHEVRTADINPARLAKVLRIVQECPPVNFEQLLGGRGVGPATVRSLALLSELIYGTPACRRDIARRWSPSDPPTFSYAHGGKDGHPFPVDRRAYDDSIAVLESAVRRAKIDPVGKDQALFRLSNWLWQW